MQLKKIEAGEATVWSSEMLVTLGATGEEKQAAQMEYNRMHQPQHK